MPYTVSYFNQRVRDEIEAWPFCVLADYARLVELLTEFGPDVRMPHSRAMGDGLFELRPRGREGIGRALYCFLAGWSCMASSRSRRPPRSVTWRSPADA